eukprot:scaffold664_cov129-Isochrysis_galbana.AAC.4
MASCCDAASWPAMSASIAPVAIAAAKPGVGAIPPPAAAAAGVRPPVPEPRCTVTDRRGSHSREGQRKTTTLAGQIAEHMRDIMETVLGGACTARCPFGKQCLNSVNRNELVRAHEHSFWDVAARPVDDAYFSQLKKEARARGRSQRKATEKKAKDKDSRGGLERGGRERGRGKQ